MYGGLAHVARGTKRRWSSIEVREGSKRALRAQFPGGYAPPTFFGILLAAGLDDPESAVRKRPLQRLGLIPPGRPPDIVLLGRRQNHRHRLRVNPADFGIRLAG